MPKMINVYAREGVIVPLEHRPRAGIDRAVVAVEDSPYYRRRIADGDLLLVRPDEGGIRHRPAQSMAEEEGE